AQTGVAQVNSDLVALQRVNDGLLRSRDGSTNAATLLDERDRLIDQISSTIGVVPSFGAHGVATLRASGPGGDMLLDGPQVATLSVTTAANGSIGFGITPSTSGSLVPVTGTLAGLASASSSVATRRSDLDALASSLAGDMNARHQAGVDASGNPGLALFNIGAGAATLTAAALAPDQVAAGDGISANGNILAFGGMRGATGAEAGWASLVSVHAQATAAARAQEAASSVRRDGAFAARSQVSEIDLDREAAELLRYQQAYEAAARTIQVAKETMQTIFNIF
ncbi:MAG: flagellar basal body rod C-terminal domain-containing protein, partial [Sphingorhabdus sp.]